MASRSRNPAEVEEEVLSLHAHRKICTPKDIGNLTVYLESEDSEKMAGETITLDGGLTSRLYNSKIC